MPIGFKIRLQTFFESKTLLKICLLARKVLILLFDSNLTKDQWWRSAGIARLCFFIFFWFEKFLSRNFMIDWISCQRIPDKNWNARCSRIPRDSFLSVDVTHLWALRPEGLIRVTTKTGKSARKLFGALPTRVWPLHPTTKIKQFFSDIYHMTSRARWPRPFNALRWKSFPRSWVSKTQKNFIK